MKKVFDNDPIGDKEVERNQMNNLALAGSSQKFKSLKATSKEELKRQEKYLMEGKPKEEVCEELIASSVKSPDQKDSKNDKMFFKLIDISAIKINISFHIEKKALNFDASRGFGSLTVLYTLVSSLANITDAPLKFKSMTFTNVFHTEDEIISNITSNYIKQGMLQFYKILGSADIIGNPVGFISKLGSGFYEFFDAPRKGMLKNPKEFLKGVKKGSIALATGAVSAGFDSSAKISGS